MKNLFTGKIIKGVGGRYKVLCDGKVYTCTARGKIKLSDKLFVGDNVSIFPERGNWNILDILPRKNLLIRPYVANVDLLVIVVSPIPEPDWILVDKLLISSSKSNVDVLMCYNKNDLGKSEYEYMLKTYGELCNCIDVSAETGDNISQLISKLKGVVCFAGQSAVGKSSLLNRLCEAGQEVGGLSKIDRGRNTTRHIEIFNLFDDVYAVDTCGFSLFDLQDIDERDLALYYPDFLELGRCKYNMCAHKDEPECKVKEAVAKGLLDEGRYKRYLAIYDEIKENRLKGR